ncbi:MAG: nucleoside-diphosphate sugar epimerase/dehydratase [Ferruginibacter sp.]
MARRILNKFAPRWIIFSCDLLLITGIFLFSYFLVRHFLLDLPHVIDFLPVLLINAAVFIICVSVFPIYKGIIRYSEINDIIRIVKFAVLQFTCWVAIYFTVHADIITRTVPLSVLFINLFGVIFILVSFRLLVKEIYFKAISKPTVTHKAIIYGAGAMGQVAKKVLEQDTKNNTVVHGYIDDSPSKIGKNLEGLPIYNASGEKLVSLLKDKGITQVFIGIDKLSVERKIAITDLCAPLNIKINVIPHASQWAGGLFQKNQVRELNIEELLERDEISLPNDILQGTYQNATVLVTGAAGSIGSEICRQLAKLQFKKLILLDQSESGLFDLEYELKNKDKRNLDLQIEIASVRDKIRMKKVFSNHKPDIVFHAAAYKHVPLMEVFPCEAILTNVFGTRLIAELSLFYNVKKFVLISTDKAVNPTNIMGATKRISEMFIQALSDNDNAKTQFIITRFGNVLGSAGSVVATFKKQINEGGPITITHPEITRYFMTIPEASKLVLEAGKIGRSGDILLFDMGKPVKILDLATRMIQLAGLKPIEDIAIIQTQLRPGEKMFEELFKESEEFIETDHPRILKAKKCSKSNTELISLLDDLEKEAISHNNEMIPFILRKMLPEFNPYLYLNKTALIAEK